MRDGMFIGSISPQATRNPHTAIGIFMDASRTFDVPAIPTGETGDSNWAKEQLDKHNDVTALRRWKKSTFGTSGNYRGMPVYTVRHGQHIDPDELDLCFEQRAKEGYPVLQAVSEERNIETPRFQLGINTLDIALFALRQQANQELDAYVEVTRRQAEAAYEITGGNIFYLIETPCATILANIFRGKEWIIDWFCRALTRIVQALPKGAAWGFHFCYGDLSNSSIGDHGKLAETLEVYRWIYKPKYSVKMISRILRYLEDRGLVPELAQIPLAFGKRPPSLDIDDYHEYDSLYVPEGVALYAGAIHHSRQTDELCKLYPKLDDIFEYDDLGVSNSCGFGRSTAEQMFRCLDHMKQIVKV